MTDRDLLRWLARSPSAGPDSATDYELLEALTRGTLSPEQSALLQARAAESEAWAEAVRAHAPPSDAERDALVDELMKLRSDRSRDDKGSRPGPHIVPSPGRDTVSPADPKGRPPRRWRMVAAFATALSAVAAAVYFAAGVRAALPGFELASAPATAGCLAQEPLRGTRSGEDCERWILRPARAVKDALEVRIFRLGVSAEAVPALETSVGERGVIQVLLPRLEPRPDQPSDTLIFLIGRTGELPDRWEPEQGGPERPWTTVRVELAPSGGVRP